jgi:hyperosmotically inducible periplasmic protein
VLLSATSDWLEEFRNDLRAVRRAAKKMHFAWFHQPDLRTQMRRFGSMLMASAMLAFTLSPGLSVRAQQPDNTAQNKSQSPTADNQSNAKNDRTLSQQVRKAIVADKDLSTYAHNVKVIAMNGQVTLKGPVKSDDEKQKVAADAASVAGADKVTNELTVKQ